VNHENICPYVKHGLTFLSSCADVNSHNKVVVCYVEGWAWYRRGNGQFLVDRHIDPMLCTHIIYAFAGLYNVYTWPITHSIQSLYSDLDTEERGGLGK
jgi:chitinase